MGRRMCVCVCVCVRVRQRETAKRYKATTTIATTIIVFMTKTRISNQVWSPFISYRLTDTTEALGDLAELITV